MKIYISSYKIYCTHYTSVYQLTPRSNCLSFRHNISLTPTLAEARLRICSNIHVFYPTVCWLLCSSSCPSHWAKPTPYQPVFLTSVFAKSMMEDLAHYSQPATLGLPNPQFHCLAPDGIHFVQYNWVCIYLNYPCLNFCQAMYFVGNALRCCLLITFNCMTVEDYNSANS